MDPPPPRDQYPGHLEIQCPHPGCNHQPVLQRMIIEHETGASYSGTCPEDHQTTIDLGDA